MSTTEAEDYVKRAEECLRLVGACIAESNRLILIYAAVHWRMLAEEAAGRERLRTGQGLTRKTLPKRLERPKAIAQELEARGDRSSSGRDHCSPMQVSWLLAD